MAMAGNHFHYSIISIPFVPRTYLICYAVKSWGTLYMSEAGDMAQLTYIEADATLVSYII
jgi:hypothetical protein